MSYLLGVDLGTTFSAAAIAEGDRVEIVTLGSRTATMPSVVALRRDGKVLTGEAAERRAVSEPTRVAREFKRRFGDPAPIVIGGTPYGAETMMAHLLRDIVDRTAEQQGGQPSLVVLSHPANYGPYKRDLLEQVAEIARVESVGFIPEPQAAAVHYATQERIEPGEVVAVYDLGGGTFDAALVRRTDVGFELVGMPAGLERFGGIDLDEAVFVHVREALGGSLEELNATDPSTISALMRLREDCRLAKEGLSSDNDTTVPVMLPHVHTEVRLTRSEFEDMIRPRLRDTVATLERVITSAGLGLGDVARILLVGGSARIPLVGELVGRATGRPVSIDTHPKHAIALGAAAAARAGAAAPAPRPAPAATGPDVTATSPMAEEADVEATTGEPASGRPDVGTTDRAAPQSVAAPSAQATDVSPATTVGAAAGADRTARRDRAPRRRRMLGVLLAGIAVVIAGIGLLVTNDQQPAAAPGDASSDPQSPAKSDGPGNDDPGALPPVTGPPPVSEVMAMYEVDYRTPAGRGGWGLWSPDDTFAPPEDIASDYYPLLGVYDSADPNVVGQHVAWMRQAGIGTAVLRWEGPESSGGEVLPLLVEVAPPYDVGFAVSIPGPGPDEFLGTVSSAIEHHGADSVWLEVPRRGEPSMGRLVILEPETSVDEDRDGWERAIEEVRGAGNAVLANSDDPAWIDVGVDGLAALGEGEPAFEWVSGLTDGALYVPVVTPGRSAERIGEPDLHLDRRSGEQYRDSWVLAHDARQPDLVLIWSFNGWLDGSQIEPAQPDQTPDRGAPPYATYGELEADGYLDLTNELAESFGLR